MSLLEVVGLHKSFKGVRALWDVSLTVEPGERHVIIGPNGAGKSTLFNTMMGFLAADAGDVRLGGTPIGRLPAHARVPLGMACTFQKNNLFEALTVEENIHLAIAACKPYRFGLFTPLVARADLRQEAEERLRAWQLWERRTMTVQALSYGEQRLVELALALVSRPRIVLLDEPTSGMSPAETAETIQRLRALPRTLALLVIEHDMDVVFAIADRITVLHHGEVFASGPPDAVRGDPRVREIYFGGTFSGGARAHVGA
jgi:branched-chain amino acid transport system ATP-binding protein